jgi:hypothetical protein
MIANRDGTAIAIPPVTMTQPQTILTWLRQLEDLDAGLQLTKNAAGIAETKKLIEALRALIPTSILNHYDGLKARRKKGVAAITERGFCGGCHIAIPRGRILELGRDEHALGVCDHCGTFLYIDDQKQTDAAKHASPIRTKKTARAKLRS